MNIIKIVALATVALISSSNVIAGALEDVAQLQKGWENANYSLKDKAQITAFEILIQQADKAVLANTDSVEVLIWQGVIKASYAGVKGGLSALSLAKSAKADFEKALKMDETALQGSSYTNLGVLYYKVPGWPIGFGDDDKAKLFLDKALAIDSEGIENNYFYADYLIDQHQYAQAEAYLLKAQHAPARPNRAMADKGRQSEISAALQNIKLQLNNKNQEKNNASITDRR
jgi:tetratricopeptide (TPR) repeat protein